ncbi:hypothetical protein EMCRGX_G000360 [Ephydatia muelleri]
MHILHCVQCYRYIDDGVVAGPIAAIARVLAIIQDRGSPLGLYINITKCELFSLSDLSTVPDEMKQSNVPHFEILGAPIGDLVFCATFVAQKQSEASKLLQQLEAVGSIDPQVALLLLRQSYIASFQSSGLSPSSGKYLSSSVDLYNSLVDPQDSLTLESVGNSHLSQKVLSSKIEDRQFGNLFHATLTDRAHLLSVSSPHTSAWLSVTPSPRLNLHLEPAEFQVALKWWLGIPVVQGQVALTVLPLCWMTLAITPSVTSANVLAWVYVWRWAVGLGSPIHNPALQMFLSLTGTLLPLTCPSRPATSKCFARSEHDGSIVSEAGVTAGVAARAAEVRKHYENDAKSTELGWICVPLTVESQEGIKTNALNFKVLGDLFGKLSFILIQSNTLKSILARVTFSLPYRAAMAMDFGQFCLVLNQEAS